MKEYSNYELAFRIIITFIEGFTGSLYVSTNGFADINNNETLKSVIIASVCSGISGVINLIKLIIDNYNGEKEVVMNEEVKMNEK